jgi:pyruvate/2-oxoglutarate/acetoin dehydrogenase E1 component
MRVVEELNAALHQLMREDPDLHIVGEDLLDPYGGAFKVTKGLSTLYPSRVLATPISEASIIGLSAGMALRGKPVIAEIMFGDFLALGMDQILNHVSKLEWMYNSKVRVPLVIRTPMGGGRGYGPTHSQSIEKHFCGIPGLSVLAVNQYSSPSDLLVEAYRMKRPCLLIENKVLYARAVEAPGSLVSSGTPDLLLVSYGGSVEYCQKAALMLRDEEEIEATVVALTTLSPFPAEAVRTAARRCRRILVVEEGSEGWGFGAECAHALVNEHVTLGHISGPAHPLPCARGWESAILPNQQCIVNTALRMFEATSRSA